MRALMRSNRGWTGGGRVRRLLSLLGIVALAVSAQTRAGTLEDIRFSSLPNDVTQIELKFDSVPPAPAGYTIDQPARIAIDLDGVTSALQSRYHSLGTGNARSVTVVEAGDRLRVIVNLTRLVAYETRVRGNSLFLNVGSLATATGAVDEPMATVRARSTEPGQSEIRDIDFRRGPEGEGQVIVKLSNPRAPVDVLSEAGTIRIEVGSTSLPQALRRRLDVSDFATAVESVDAVEQSGRAVITIRPQGAYDYLAFQADDTLTVNVHRPRADDVARMDDPFRFRGDKLSLNFQDIEVRSVLQLIADFTDMNLVASDTVGGRITLRLQNVPWDQALEIVLRTKGLDKREVGNVLMVGPAAEIAARERQDLDNQRQIQELAPLRSEFIQVRYANAGQIVQLFRAGEGEGRLLSERGSVIVDDRTNAIIITDTSDRLADIRRVMQQIDIPVRQVQIEARIVTANTNFTESLGIRWGGGYRNNVGSGDNFLTIGGSQPTLGEAVGGNVTFPNAFAVDLPVASATSSFAIGITGQDYLLDLEISALASDGQAEVVARPKVITADKQTATVASGVEIPFQEAAASGATATQFKEAVLSLEVTPQITPDDRIIMDLAVNQDSVGQVFGGIPSINTNSITTQVLVDNGQTLVLGGIFQTSSSRSTDKTPFLGDLPVVGGLFRRKLQSEEKQELLIFITPRIIQDTLTRR